MRIWSSALLLASLLAACGSNSAADRRGDAAPAQTPTVLDDQLRAIDKAKAVNDQMLNRVHDLDQQIEQPDDGGARQQGAADPASGRN